MKDDKRFGYDPATLGQDGRTPDLAAKAFTPLGILVVLQMVPRDKTPGGIQLPDSVKELDMVGLEPANGWVVSAGCQCRYVRRGDLVIVQGNLI